MVGNEQKCLLLCTKFFFREKICIELSEVALEMKNEPLVSVIIPCYNHGKCIMDAVNSVLEQTYQNIEILIINDGSSDLQTIDLLNSINNSKIEIIHQENAGPCVAKNNGILKSKGEYILPLDCDNKLRNEMIMKVVNIIKKTNVDIVYCDYQFFGEKNDKCISEKFDIKKLLKYNFIENCSLYKRKVWEETGGYDVFLSKKGIEDWEFWINAARHNSSFFHLNEILFDYRVSQSSRTNTEANKNLDETVKYVYKKHSELLAKTFLELYHENKNFRMTPDFRLGKMMLKPWRVLKKVFISLLFCL